MSFLEPCTLQLISRNEGKIKSYESCFDIRAWSHDICTRDRYLKEWIRCDMPYAIVPLSCVIGILRTMSCRSRGRVAPRCHLDCKSKVILEGICTSCHAMKECLKNDQKFEKYFVEEDLETSHWPCERCLEALKSIKMFWKVIVEKVFNINVSKNVMFQDDKCCPTNSIRDVARMWQKDLVQQAVLVKAITDKKSSSTMKTCYSKKPTSCYRISKMCSESDRGSVLTRKSSRCTIPSADCQKGKGVRSSTCDVKKCDRPSRRKQCRCSSVRVKTCDAGCNTIRRSECEELRAYRAKMECIKREYDAQTVEIEKLKNENCVLKQELEVMCNSCKWKSSIYKSRHKPDRNSIVLVPKPFECCIEENNQYPLSESAKDAESEMVITMKNCKNENFKHVSLLQVLHKSNELPYLDKEAREVVKAPCYKKEDPIELLTKVQSTLGAIFSRELSMSAGRKRIGCEKISNIEASFQNVSPCISRSCITMPSRSKSRCNLN